ncbi:MAG: hypothetical protein ACFFKA_13980 [Candidatus Thorarchaeota archaeon]
MNINYDLRGEVLDWIEDFQRKDTYEHSALEQRAYRLLAQYKLETE